MILPMPAVAPLTAELEAALVRELATAYDNENWSRFGSRLVRPLFALSGSEVRLGRWLPLTRTIELSRTLLLDRPWPDVVSVLQHEMAHQFVDEVLRIHDETSHGETFRTVCARLGIDAAAVGAPAAPTGAIPAPDRVLERVRKLLALAGSPNLHEAEIAMQRAHELMLRHNIEAASATAARDFEIRYLGDPLRRTNAVEAAIMVLLSECFFVRVIRVPIYLPRLGKRGALYELTGTAANLELALHVHAFLRGTADRLWAANRADARVRSGRDRLAYQTGVIRGFHDKLRAERSQLAGTGLVWRGDARLDAFYRQRNPRIATQRSAAPVNHAHLAGREAGQHVILNRPIADGPGEARHQLRSGD